MKAGNNALTKEVMSASGSQLQSKIGNLAICFVLSLAVCALAFAMSRSGAMVDVELWGYDFLVNHAGYRTPDPNLVLVDFDDATVSTLNQFPIRRGTIALVIDKIAAAKARVIGLDVFLSEPRGAEEDAQMQKALTTAGNVILASQLAARGLPPVIPMSLVCTPETDASDAGFCEEGKPGAMGFAFVNMPIDADGFIRSMRLLPDDPSEPVSFPVALAQLYSGQAIHAGKRNAVIFLGREIPYSDRDLKSALIGRWNPRPVKRLSAIDVLNGRVNLANELRDKLVLIGQGSDAARDRHFTPVFRPPQRALISGTEVHAAAIATLLDGPTVSVARWPLTWVVILTSVVLAVWLTLRLPLRYGLAGVAFIMIALYAGAQLAFDFGHAWMRFLTGELAVAISLPVSLTYQFILERFRSASALAEREQIMQMFSRYVSPEAAAQIWERRSELSLAGEERSATVMFTDIRNFTQLTAGKSSPAVLTWLNRYLTAMDEVIREEGGFLNKFIGDGLMVLFGVPLSEGLEEDAWRAVRCGLRMLERAEQMNKENAADPAYLPIRIGVGIHTGVLTCGSVGSQSRLEYSVIGETVNLASRLESATKDFKVPLVMSASTYDAVRTRVTGARDLGSAKVKGFDSSIHVYTLDVSSIGLSSSGFSRSKEVNE
jgi:adenylate cyclase